jgi:RNA polymerase sigma-70 factor (ECF subfamily)
LSFHQPPITSLSLLERLRHGPEDTAAWADFVDRYGTVLYDWCRRWNLQDADARDVTQAILLRLVRGMKTFQHENGRSFRGWLWTVAHNAWQDFIASRRKNLRSGLGGQPAEMDDPLDTVVSRDDMMSRLDREFDRELLAEAQARVRLRVEAKTWDAFVLSAEEDVPAAEAAKRLGMTVAATFKAKSKVLRMLREEIRKLEGETKTPGKEDA